jgi:hypothetical protein
VSNDRSLRRGLVHSHRWFCSGLLGAQLEDLVIGLRDARLNKVKESTEERRFKFVGWQCTMMRFGQES